MRNEPRKGLFFSLQSKTSAPRLALYAIMLCALAASACQNGEAVKLDQPADWASGPDARRHGANEVTLDTTVVDYVDVPGGDRTDWKYFTVPASGVIDLTVTFDNPKALGQVLVVDEVGKIIASFEDEKRRLLDKITFKANSGRYYVQVWVLDEDSSYSIQAAYQPLQIGSF